MRTTERSALLIGFAMGGFLDFILLHLVLQWHHMISRRLPPESLEALRRNIFWDGIGELAMWLLTLAGVLMLYRSARRGEPFPSARRWAGLLVVGWGGFNLLDGLLNHHLLALHDVREDVANPMAWNLGFMLVAGIALPLLGWILARRPG